MGNLCGKSSKDDAFSSPGRTLGSAPPQPSAGRAPIPNRQAKTSGPGRTVGGNPSYGTTDDPKAAAARAAEQRAQQSSKTKGKLSEQLAAQKRQTRTDTLEQVSRENRAARGMDEGHEARAYN